MTLPRAAPPREKARREEAERLDVEILSAIGGGWEEPLPEDEFDLLARLVFAHQFRFIPAYRQLCGLAGVSAPADVSSWREIPPVPAGAFKVSRWASFPPEAEVAAFRTSGTTQGATGVHRLDTLGLANAAILQSARRYVVPDREGIRCLFLTPPPGSARESSLIQADMSWRERSWTRPWYCRSVTAGTLVRVAMTLLPPNGAQEPRSARIDHPHAVAETRAARGRREAPSRSVLLYVEARRRPRTSRCRG